ncbi:hypothetical protein EYC84_008304 [Monilinia fructicola]|uniref:Uncharacterized protein n=1 Tax=Monilinia fructicola TaxID=38448 RepID=A0A5M9JIP1_MONFR|nr:hypothetical protein EYC84_008304 [Monilinia fructicola]
MGGIFISSLGLRERKLSTWNDDSHQYTQASSKFQTSTFSTKQPTCEQRRILQKINSFRGRMFESCRRRKIFTSFFSTCGPAPTRKPSCTSVQIVALLPPRIICQMKTFQQQKFRRGGGASFTARYGMEPPMDPGMDPLPFRSGAPAVEERHGKTALCTEYLHGYIFP